MGNKKSKIKVFIVDEKLDYSSDKADYTIHLKKRKKPWWLLLFLIPVFLLSVWLLPKPKVRIPVPSTGDVQLLMSWNDLNDLDLSCEDPSGDIVSFDNREVPSGGQLEIDMNADVNSRTPIENIFWPKHRAPYGTYTVYGTFYNQKEPNISTSHYKLKVVYGDKTEWFEGDLSKDQGRVFICSFTYEKKEEQ